MMDSTFKLSMAAGIMKPTSRTDIQPNGRSVYGQLQNSHQNRTKKEKQNIKEKKRKTDPKGQKGQRKKPQH